MMGDIINYAEVCVDEIALEGLDGITLSALWVRINARRTTFPLKLDDSTKEYLWNCIIRDHGDLEFYALPKPRLLLELYDRFKNTDPETGVLVQAETHPMDIYPISIIENDPNGIKGSCADYRVRTNITSQVRNAGRSHKMDLLSVAERWGEKFVIVASQSLRSMALFGCRRTDPDLQASISDVKYAILERIGRARYHGETTQSDDGLKVFDVSTKSMFYIRKILRGMGLITVQSICVRMPKLVTLNGKLIHLTRFYVEFHPMYMKWLEELTSRLSAKPYHLEQLSTLRSEMGIKERSFKKLYNLGKEYIRCETSRYRDAFPGADEEEYMRKSKTGERSIRIIRLIKPFVASTMLDDEDEEESEEFSSGKKYEDNEKEDDLDVTVANGKEVVHSDSLVCDRTMLSQVMSCIEKLGGKGQSMVDLSLRFGITKLDGRSICRNLERKQSVVRHMQDEGKARVARFVSKTVLDSGTSFTPVLSVGYAQENASQIFETEVREGLCQTRTHAKEESAFHVLADENKEDENLEYSFNQSVDTSIIKCDDITMSIENQEKKELLELLKVFPENSTVRTLRRAKTILMAVQQAKVVADPILIQKKIRMAEASDKAVMDRRSFYRLVERMHSTNLIRKVVYPSDGSQREMVFLCDVSITDEDPLLKSTVATSRQKRLTMKAEVNMDATVEKKPEVIAPSVPLYDANAGRRCGYLPRLARLKILHQFLWYLTYNQEYRSNNVKMFDLQQSVAGNGFHSMPNKIPQHPDAFQSLLPVKILEESFSCGWDALSWQKALQQLPKHSGYGDGWCCVFDILQIMPVYLLLQIVNIMYKVNGIETFLEDPIKRLTAFGQLPLAWQKVISHKRKHISGFFERFKELAKLGLLSFGKREYQHLEQSFIYIHRRATLIDTTSAEIPRSEFPVRSYFFESFHDVEDYWLTLQSISFNTPFENVLPESKPRNQQDGRFEDCLRCKDVNDITDKGLLPGDGMGGAGTDSTFFSNRRPNWSYNADIDVKTETLINDGQYLANERYMTRALQGKNVKRVKKNSERKEQKRKANDSDEWFVKDTVTGTVPKRGGKGKQQKRNTVVEGLLKKSRKFKEKQSQTTKSESQSNNTRAVRIRDKKDGKDIEALALQKRRRVAWTREEDSLLLVCQLTNQFLTGQRKLKLVGNTVIRDIMHEKFEISKDKTRLACSRRIKQMCKNSVTVQNVRMYLGEALQDKELVKEFKEGKTYIITRIEENAAVFKACLAKMLHKFRSQQFDTTEALLMLPDTIEELHSHFSVIKDGIDVSKSCHKDVVSESEIVYSVLHNTIHAATVLEDKSSRKFELYRLYKQYDDMILQSVYASMVKDRIITKIKKVLDNPRQTRCRRRQVPTLGVHQVSQRYVFYWISIYERSLFLAINTSLKKLPPDPYHSDYGSDFLDLQNNPGDISLTITLMAMQLITFEMTVPTNIVHFDSKSKEKQVCRDQRPPPTKKRRTDDDSDLEAEAVIEEAERDRNETASYSDVYNESLYKAEKFSTQSRIRFTQESHQRTVHREMVRRAGERDGQFMTACDVRIRLVPSELRDVQRHAVLKSSDKSREARKEISDWNATHVILHPKTCDSILKTVRVTFPVRVPADATLENCCRKFSFGDSALLKSIYNKIRKHESLGIDVYELKEAFAHVSSHDLMDYVEVMIEYRVVVRVGVTVFRFVCLEFANSWMITIDKNLKGRGVLHDDEIEEVEDEVNHSENLPSCPFPSTANVYVSSTNKNNDLQVHVTNDSSVQLETHGGLSEETLLAVQTTGKKHLRSEIQEHNNQPNLEESESNLTEPSTNMDVDEEVLESSPKPLELFERNFISSDVVCFAQVKDERNFSAKLPSCSFPSTANVCVSSNDKNKDSEGCVRNDPSVQLETHDSMSEEILFAFKNTGKKRLRSETLEHNDQRHLEESESNLTTPSTNMDVVEEVLESSPKRPRLCERNFDSTVKCSEMNSSSITVSGLASLTSDSSNSYELKQKTVQCEAETESMDVETISEAPLMLDSENPAKAPFKQTACTNTQQQSHCEPDRLHGESHTTMGLQVSFVDGPMCKFAAEASSELLPDSNLLSDAGTVCQNNVFELPVSLSCAISSSISESLPPTFIEMNYHALSEIKMPIESSLKVQASHSQVKASESNLAEPQLGNMVSAPKSYQLCESKFGCSVEPPVSECSKSQFLLNTTKATDSALPVIKKLCLASQNSTSQVTNSTNLHCQVPCPAEATESKASMTNELQPNSSNASSEAGLSSVSAASSNPPCLLTPSAPVKIRFTASSLSSLSGSNDLAKQIQGLLAKHGSLQPGQQIKLRVPAGTSLVDFRAKTTPLTTSALAQSVTSGDRCLSSSVSGNGYTLTTMAGITHDHPCNTISAFNEKSAMICVSNGQKEIRDRSSERMTTSSVLNCSKKTMIEPSISSCETSTSSVNSVQPAMSATSRLEELLSKQGSLQPGQQIRIRVPAGTLLSGTGLNQSTATGCDSGEQKNTLCASQIQEFLAKRGLLEPGRQIRLRFRPGSLPPEFRTSQMSNSPHSAITATSDNLKPGHTTSALAQSVTSADSCLSSSVSGTECSSTTMTGVTHDYSCNTTGAFNEKSAITFCSNGQREIRDCSSDRMTATSDNLNLSKIKQEADFLLAVQKSCLSPSAVLQGTVNVKLNHADADNQSTVGGQNYLIPQEYFIPQLDGTSDEKLETTTDEASHQSCAEEKADAHNLNNAENTESEVGRLEYSDKMPPYRLRNVHVANIPPPPTGTYRKIRLIPRPWRTPEGTVNRTTLQTMLEAVLLYVVENPGITRSSVINKYNPALQPVAVFELLEMLEEIGCLKRSYLQRSQRPSLFSSRSLVKVVSEDRGSETEVFLPTPGCILKLGQFVAQLLSNMRSGS